ncbi:MAG: hypothetical protein AAF517_04280, partial [Planctomycetota bacterium]
DDAAPYWFRVGNILAASLLPWLIGTKLKLKIDGGPDPEREREPEPAVPGQPRSLGLSGVFVGLIAGSVLAGVIGVVLVSFYSPLGGLSEASGEEEKREWFEHLQAVSYVYWAISRGLGCLGGAAVASLVTGRRSAAPAVLTGAFFAAYGFKNLSEALSPPDYLYVVPPMFFLLGWIAGRSLRRESPDVRFESLDEDDESSDAVPGSS